MYKARVLEIPNTKLLASADEYQKIQIDSLREKSLQTFNEQDSVEEIKCDYNLVIIEFK